LEVEKEELSYEGMIKRTGRLLSYFSSDVGIHGLPNVLLTARHESKEAAIAAVAKTYDEAVEAAKPAVYEVLGCERCKIVLYCQKPLPPIRFG